MTSSGIEQTVVWTALPDGTAVSGTAIDDPVAKISVFVSPRLRQDSSVGSTLDPFTDFLDWPKTVDNISRLLVRFDTGEEIEARPVSPNPRQSQLWRALFKSDTFVRPYTFDDYNGRLVISYPAHQVYSHMKQLYQAVGLHSYSEIPPKYVYHGETLPEAQGWLQDVGISWNARLARSLRRQLIEEQQSSEPPDPPYVFGTAAPTVDRSRAFQQMLLFHSPPVDPNSSDVDFPVQEDPPLLPQTEEDFKEALDFHQALSSLGDYPLLLRRLGIVIDLELPLAEMPPDARRVQVAPEWEPALAGASQDRSNWTAFVRENGRFAAAPRNPDNLLIRDGLLTLSPDAHALMQVDVDGAAIKSVDFAVSLNHEQAQHSDDTPETAGLPTIRSAGFSVLELNRYLSLLGHFAHTRDLNDALESGDPPTLFAEDLVRGYRVDVWHSHNRQWHSLNSRVGRYRIVGESVNLANLEDEGFTQMGMTGAASTAEGQEPVNDDVKLHESLFRWDGWSLVAPRPGKAVSSSADPDEPPEEPANDPLTPFKLKTEFKPADASLPRLRFGAGYRLRVRVADLAGNGVTLADAPETPALPALAHPPETYLRFEPLAPPQLTPRQPLTDQPGESVARLVIRSFNDTPEKDTAVTPATSERHVSPPRTSQLMLETHGAFDDENGRLRDENAVYNFIANRDKPVDPTGTAEPVDPARQMPINYLPEALAVGAALRDLPGTAEETLGDIDELNRLLYTLLTDNDARPGSATRIPYAPTHRNPDGLLALYTFNEGSGAIVHDVSGVGAPLDLTIEDETAVAWQEGALSVLTPTLIASGTPAAKIISAARASDALTVEAWITPAAVLQDGPARIVTCSRNPHNRNFTLGHGRWGDRPKTVFNARLRTTGANANGEPSLTTPVDTVLPAMMHVVYTRDAAGNAVIYVDGQAVVSDTVSGTLNNWGGGMRLALANELTGDRPWLGTYHLVAVYDRALSAGEVNAHCVHGSASLPQTRIPLWDRLQQLKAFRVQLAEGGEAPAWDAAGRVLTITLPKATVWQGLLSSTLLPADLRLMGVWQWLREYVNAQTADPARTPHELEQLASELATMVQYAVEGGHWMLTPPRPLTLVHAVQQPLGHPAFHTLAANRPAGATGTYFAGTLRIHGHSTAKIDLMARWEEPADRLEEDAPTWLEGNTHVAEIPLKQLTSGLIAAPTGDGATAFLGNYDAAADAINFVAVLGGAPRSPLHVFGDTKRRVVHYHAVASSRFREYFDADVSGGFARSSAEITVDVPSSERPSPPRLVYVIPAYGWQRQTTTNMIASRREGGTLRVYLERPWYSSGQGELLGVVLSRDTSLSNVEREARKQFITQWGEDPIWRSRASGFPRPAQNLPTIGVFTTRVTEGTNLPLAELGEDVNVAAHNVTYDNERRLWYCDIEVNPGEAYMPFIRLALARYQPNSVSGKHLSTVVLADFAQLAPDRAAILTFDPYRPEALTLTVSGFTYTHTANLEGDAETARPVIKVFVEQRDPQIGGDLGWMAATDTAVSVQTEGADGQILWRGTITLPPEREPGMYRLVICEYEVLLPQRRQPRVQRLVYADILPL